MGIWGMKYTRRNFHVRGSAGGSIPPLTTTNTHHQFFNGNYGLYFLWWDRWMGTLRTDYDRQFDDVKNRVAA